MRLRLSKAALHVSASTLLAASLAGCSAGSRAQVGDGRRETRDVQRPAGETPKTETPKAEAPKTQTPKTETPVTKRVSSSASDDSTQTAAGAGGSTDATEARVIVENFAFSPASLTVAAGTKVTWVNRDTDPHTATSTDKRFNSGALDTGEEFSFVFKDKGDYEYYCALHPHMKGRITVK
jgi:plastocyanin